MKYDTIFVITRYSITMINKNPKTFGEKTSKIKVPQIDLEPLYDLPYKVGENVTFKVSD